MLTEFTRQLFSDPGQHSAVEKRPYPTPWFPGGGTSLALPRHGKEERTLSTEGTPLS